MEKLQDLPKHIAIIMDGNRRWAKQNNLDTKSGHKKGADNLEKIADYANSIGLEHLTVYAFSTENWKRTEQEVGDLMMLLNHYLKDFLNRTDTKNIRLRILGDITKLNISLQKEINQCVERTKNNTGLQFNIAFNYGGRDEIIKAVKNIASKIKNNEIQIDDINEQLISDNLYTYGQPDPELLIRTSGEMRTSNFLPWQLVYSEFIFVEKYWPDFNEQDLLDAINEYKGRNRRFGGK